MRGGVSYISKRCSKANNKYLKSYDPKQESKHIVNNLDANNIYGYAMSKFLSTGGLKWIDSKVFNSYLKELCKLHNDYLMAQDKIEIKKMFSKYHLLIADSYNIYISNVEKLTPNFFEKEKYVLHYENLQLYFRPG